MKKILALALLTTSIAFAASIDQSQRVVNILLDNGVSQMCIEKVCMISLEGLNFNDDASNLVFIDKLDQNEAKVISGDAASVLRELLGKDKVYKLICSVVNEEEVRHLEGVNDIGDYIQDVKIVDKSFTHCSIL